MEISYVVKDADRWEVNLARVASRFDVEYYGMLMKKAWEEATYAIILEHSLRKGAWLEN